MALGFAWLLSFDVGFVGLDSLPLLWLGVCGLSSPPMGLILWFDIECVGFATLMCGSAGILWFAIGSAELVGSVSIRKPMVAFVSFFLLGKAFFLLGKARIFSP